MVSVVDKFYKRCDFRSSMTQDFHFHFDETFHIEISQWPESLKVQVHTTLYIPLGLKYNIHTYMYSTCITVPNYRYTMYMYMYMGDLNLGSSVGRAPLVECMRCGFKSHLRCSSKAVSGFVLCCVVLLCLSFFLSVLSIQLHNVHTCICIYKRVYLSTYSM